MPGISFRCKLSNEGKAGALNMDGLFLSALDSAAFSESIKSEVLLAEKDYLLGSTRYPEYPVKTIDVDRFWICIEGRIYGKEDKALETELNELLNCVFSYKAHDENNKKVIADWLLRTDGEFAVFALDKKTGDFAIMNDVLGRLPLYYYYVEKTEIIVSRELQFISNLTQNGSSNADRFDRIGISQLLLFRHTLGRRTLLSNTYRIEPATLVKIYKKNSEVTIDCIYRFNFDKEEYASDSIKKNAENLLSLFSEACKNRALHYGNRKNLISLSGGSDSRAVAACFHLNKIPSYAATRVDRSWAPSMGKSSEADIAKELANLFGIGWENFNSIEPTVKDMIMLLNLKHGMCYLAFSFLLPFMDELKQKHGPPALTIFTGHGGDIILTDLRPKRKIRDTDDLVGRIIQGRGYLPLNEVAALAGIQESEIVGEIKSILLSYPEKNLNQKYVHYLFYEIDFKFGFESEDINRSYFWSVSPFYATPFFKYAMNCASNNKSQQALYREFLFRLSPSAAAVANSNWGCSILSRRYKLMQFIQSLTFRYRLLRKIIRGIKERGKGYSIDSQIIRCIDYQTNNCGAVSKYLSRSKIARILNHPGNYSRVAIDNLFTITSLIDQACCDSKGLQNFYNK